MMLIVKFSFFVCIVPLCDLYFNSVSMLYSPGVASLDVRMLYVRCFLQVMQMLSISVSSPSFTIISELMLFSSNVVPVAIVSPHPWICIPTVKSSLTFTELGVMSTISCFRQTPYSPLARVENAIAHMSKIGIKFFIASCDRVVLDVYKYSVEGWGQ